MASALILVIVGTVLAAPHLHRDSAADVAESVLDYLRVPALPLVLPKPHRLVGPAP